MSSWSNQPAFVAYAVASVLLCGNLMFLWFASAVARARSRTAINEEDAAQFGTTLVAADPPTVARILRAHDNAQASIYPFLLLGLTFVIAGGSATAATVVFGVFTAARLLHTIAYLKGLQPWRTGFFVTGASCVFALMIGIVWLLVRAA